MWKVIEYHTGAPNPVIAIPTFSGGQVCPLIVSNISAEEVQILTDGQVWATASVAFAAWPSTEFTSQYMLTLLHLDIPVDNTPAAQDVIVTALSKDTFYKAFVLANRDAYPLHWKDDHCLRHSLSTIRCVGRLLGVRGTDKKTVTFDFYFKPPTNNPTPLNKLYHYLQQQKFPTIWGTAVARLPYFCSTCLSLDHPTGLCAFPELPGWPMSTEALQEALGNSLTSPTPHQCANNGNPIGKGPKRGGHNGGRGVGAPRSRGGKTSGRGRT